MLTKLRAWLKWAVLEAYLLEDYTLYWVCNCKPGREWLPVFNHRLCVTLILFYLFVGTLTGYPKRPPVFKAWYIKLCHNYMRGIKS
jgi:hypothetical protein